MKEAIKRILPRAVMQAYEAECRKETHINRALRLFGADTPYIEIGVRDGVCVHQINSPRKAAVDPAPVDPGFIESDGTVLFQTTSDDFFEAGAATWLDGRRVNVAFVDGLHEFRQALRDVLHLESVMARKGVIFVHDCNPITRRHEQDMDFTWNGDVWKVPYYLSQYRPDLQYFTLDCDWGLGVLTNFSSQPPKPDDAGIDLIKNLDYAVLEENRQAILKLRNPLYSRFYFSGFRH